MEKELDSNKNAQELILEETESKHSDKIKALKNTIKDREKTIKNLRVRLESDVDASTQTVIEEFPNPLHSNQDTARSEAAGG